MNLFSDKQFLQTKKVPSIAANYSLVETGFYYFLDIFLNTWERDDCLAWILELKTHSKWAKRGLELLGAELSTTKSQGGQC